jgi:hypothetical protein
MVALKKDYEAKKLLTTAAKNHYDKLKLWNDDASSVKNTAKYITA